MPISELSKHLKGINLAGKAYKELPVLNKRQIKAVVLHITDLKDKRRTGKVIEWINLLLTIDHESLHELKKSGIFRLNNSLDSLNYPHIISDHILKNQHTFQLKEDSLSFISSAHILSQFHPELKIRKSEIVKDLKIRKKTILKSLYSFLDAYFQREKVLASKELSQFTREQIAESISYIVFIYDELIGITDDSIMFSDVDYILDGRIERIVLNACYIRLIQETEIEIECLNYKCITSNDGVKVIPPSAKYAKTYCYGNTLLDMHRLSRGFLDNENGCESLYSYAEKINKVTNGAMLYYTEVGGVYRYAMAIPKELLDLLFKSNSGLLSPGFFKEEIRYLQEMENELHISKEDLYKPLIADDFTFHDLLIARRIFIWFTYAYFELLKTKSDREYYSSNVSTLLESTLMTLLEQGIGKKKTAIFLDLFSYTGKEKLLDIQYTPLLKANDFFLVPFNVLANSNLFRNILYGKNIRIYDNGSIDPLSIKLSKELKAKGFWVKTDFKFKFGSESSDIDVLAGIGNNIFIFECKNNLLPVNAFELRNMFSSLEKASVTQLPLSKKACSDMEFIKKYGLPIENKDQLVNVYSCTVTGNKLFSGYELYGFPIRNVNELCTFIKKGTFGLIDLESGLPGIHCLWDSSTFSVRDLVKYLDLDTEFFKFIIDSFDEEEKTYNVGKMKLNYLNYSLNHDSLIDNFAAMNYRKI